MNSPESRQPELSNDTIRELLSPSAEPIQHIDGLLALGIDQEELFGLLEITGTDLGLISDNVIEAEKERVRDDPEITREVLLEFGVKEEDLYDVEAYIEERARNHNQNRRDLFTDPAFLDRRRQRIFDDLRKTAAILMERDANRPLIADWLIRPNEHCDSDRPIDKIKFDPIMVHVAARHQAKCYNSANEV